MSSRAALPVVCALALLACSEPDAPADGPPAGAAADTLRIEAIPSSWRLDVGEQLRLDVHVLEADGTRRPVASPRIELPGGPGVLDAALVGSTPGLARVRVTVEGRSVEVPVRVGPDVWIAGGAAAGLYPVDAETGLESRFDSVGGYVARVRRVGSRLVVVSSGDVFGGSEPSRLSVVDLDGGGTVSQASGLLGDGQGAYDFAQVTDAAGWVIGHRGGIVPVDLDALTAGALVDVASQFPAISVKLDSGGAGLVLGDTLVVANPGLRPDFSYEPGALLLLDAATGSAIDANASEPGINPLRLPDGCFNPGWLDLDRNTLVVGCGGNFADVGAAVVLLDARTLRDGSLIPVSASGASSFALDAARHRVIIGSGAAADAWVVDLDAGRLLRGDDAPAWFVPGRAADFDFAAVHVDATGMSWAATYGTSQLFGLDPELQQATPPLDLDFEATRIAPVAIASGWLGEAPAWAGTGGIVDASGAALDALTGAPGGGGATTPNAAATDLVTVSDGGVLELHLPGVAVLDGPGADFVVYENAFYAGGDRSLRAADPATVEVSSDGTTWVAIPAVLRGGAIPSGIAIDARLFGEGYLGIEPVFANATNALGPGSLAAGGDRFDIAATGLDSVRAIRIIDVAGDGRSPDLDALAWIHWRQE
jgi:hypothetical protein